MIDPAGRSETVAVMQPYFYPYLAYFALLGAVDTFVIFDCVQFPRRGRVHRTEVAKRNGVCEWLTLPLAAQPRDTLIRDLRFAPGATEEFHRRLQGSPTMRGIFYRLPRKIQDHLTSDLTSPAAHLESGLMAIADLFEFETKIVRSSSFEVPDRIRGQDRVIAVARAAGGKRYLNATGGTHLYDSARFSASGLELEFLPGYTGRHWHLLPALATTDHRELAREARAFGATRQS